MNDLSPGDSASTSGFELVSLDVGCGMKKHVGSVGIDVRKLHGVDVVADVRNFPFRDDSFDEVFLSHIVEHNLDLLEFMKEIWRISKHHATIRIWTPHFTTYHSYRDLAHVHHLSSQSFDYFDPTTILGKIYWVTKEIEFRVRKKRLLFDERRPWNYIVEKIANKYVLPYEAALGWIFPASELYIELEAIKEQS